jgi:hypothetical protein
LLNNAFLGNKPADLPGFYIYAQNLKRDWDNVSGYFHTVMNRMDLSDIHANKEKLFQCQCSFRRQPDKGPNISKYYCYPVCGKARPAPEVVRPITIEFFYFLCHIHHQKSLNNGLQKT